MSHIACPGIFLDQEKIHRIHIIGAAGSGKTTLARALAAQFDLSIYHLDEIYSRHRNETKDLFKVLSADVHRIASQYAWITEGVYLRWTDELLQRADLVIWLDIPWHLAVWHQLVRYIWLGLTRPSSRPVMQKITGLFRFLLTELPEESKYYLDSTIMCKDGFQDTNAKNRVTTVQCLAPYADKLVCLRKPSEIETFLSSIK